ncbi:proton-coupled folate transporter-like [Stylophora pistillata]|uniref:Proton-coupled folate transporter n=1 Tax=Stylophora pistillata TaxID=50429 RepID=A0A2B4S622_STYPI|nr:proton-coupled folate transporter-like [Stylophora pistillata]PFX24836.1 Proton-coupled folate transporter [Stylophora pistillata]
MLRKKLPTWRRYLTVEPVIFFYAYGLVMSRPIFGQYVYSVISQLKGFPYEQLLLEKEGLGCQEHFAGANNTLVDLEKEVQSLATKIDTGNMFFLAIPSLIMAPFWGPWTDKSHRRKPALLAPVIGAFLGSVVMLMVMYFEWPLYVTFIGSALTGLSGFLTTLSLAVMSYIADTTEKNEVAFRLAIIQMLIFMGGVVSQLTSGFWIHRFGFIIPTWIILGCNLISGLWVIFLVPESHEKASHEKHNFFDIKSLKVLVNVFRKEREVGRKSLLLLVVLGAIITLTTMGLGGVTDLFVMRSPLCFGPKLVGYFLAYRMFFSGVGGAVGVKLLGKFFSELTACGISIVSQIGEMVLLAFSTRTWLVFVAPMLGCFKSSVNPIIASILSRIVGDDEQGSLFCTIGMINIFSQFLGVMLFNNVYERTLHLTFGGFVFLLCAAIKLIPFCFFRCVQVPPTKERQEIREEMKLKDDEKNGNKQEDKLFEENGKVEDQENENEMEMTDQQKPTCLTQTK